MKLIAYHPSERAVLTGYLRDQSDEMPAYNKRPAIVLCPGGGYNHCSTRESDPVALQFFAAGYAVFTLLYSTGVHSKNWQPMIELSRSILYLRQNADALGILPDKIAACGFSAGGHLAGCGGLLWNAAPVQAAAPAPGGENRPNAMILCYPVITSGPYAHTGSFDNIAGQDEALRREFSLERHVTPQTPPVFLWHTVADDCVPVQNSLLLAEALEQNGVPFELHLFAGGPHGASTCTAEVNNPIPHNAHWLELCLEWLDDTFGYSIR